MKFIAIILTTIIFAGCMTTQKAKNFLEKEGALDSICMEEYKPVDSIVIRDSISFDTLFLETVGQTDTVTKNDTVYITKTLPAKVITKTVTHTKEVFTENTARVKYLENRLSEASQYASFLEGRNKFLEERGDDWKKKAHKRMSLLIILIAAFAGWTFRKPLMGVLGKFF